MVEPPLHLPHRVNMLPEELPIKHPITAGKPPRRAVPASATIALIMAVVPCCPLISLAGGLLGLLVLGRMQRQGAGRDAPGRKVALAAAILGLLVSIISTGIFAWWQQRVDAGLRRESVDELEQVIRASMNSDALTARSVWRLGATAPTGDEFITFGQTLQHRYGRFQRFAIDSFEFGGSALAPTIEMSGVFTFETRDLPGSAKYHVGQASGLFSMDLGLVQIVLEDRTLGDLEIAE